MSRRGKKVLDIEWGKDGSKVKVPVKAFTVGHYESEKQMTFRAEFKEAGIDVEGTDINVVRAEVVKKLEAWFSIDWELYFLVVVEGGEKGNRGTRFEVLFRVDFYVIGKDVRGVSRYMMIPRPDDIANWKTARDGGPTRWSGENVHEGTPKTGGRIEPKYSYGRREVRTQSLVLATPENVAAADRFVVAMQGLLDKMHDHFAPDKIEKMLTRIPLLLGLDSGEAKR